MHLNEALDHERIEYRYLGPRGKQVVGHGQVVRASGFEHVETRGPAAAHQLPKPGGRIGYFQVLKVRANLVAHS